MPTEDPLANANHQLVQAHPSIALSRIRALNGASQLALMIQRVAECSTTIGASVLLASSWLPIGLIVWTLMSAGWALIRATKKLKFAIISAEASGAWLDILDLRLAVADRLCSLTWISRIHHLASRRVLKSFSHFVCARPAQGGMPTRGVASP